MRVSVRQNASEPSEVVEFIPRKELDRAEREIERLRKQNERLRQETERLRRELEAALRASAFPRKTKIQSQGARA